MKQASCSFCGKPHSEVRKLIAGPKGIYICDSCLIVCKSILDKEDGLEITKELTKETKEFEHRLQVLRELVRKREISEAEYKNKRKQLLEQLWKTKS